MVPAERGATSNFFQTAAFEGRCRHRSARAAAPAHFILLTLLFYNMIHVQEEKTAAQ